MRGCQVAKYTLPRVDPKLTTLCPKGEEIAPTPAPGWLLSRIGFSPRTLGRPLPPGHHQSTLPAHLSRPLRLDRPLAVHVITLSDTIYRLWCSEAQTTPIVDATHRPCPSPPPRANKWRLSGERIPKRQVPSSGRYQPDSPGSADHNKRTISFQ